MSSVEIHLRYMPAPHYGWEAYMMKDGERWGGNSMTYDDPFKAMTLLAQNLAETLERMTSL